MDAPPRQTGGPTRVAAALHLTGLSTLALAQPLFDVLSKDATFFAASGLSALEIVVFALALAFVPPALLVGLELAAALASPRAGAVTHLALVAFLLALLALQALKRGPDLGVPAALLVAAASGGACALVYGRFAPVRAAAGLLALAPLVAVALFLFASPVARLVAPGPEPAHASPRAAATPVVLVVFDELSGTSLVDRRLRIDAARFPHLAALAAEATWFPNTTTAHWDTVHALPALLTGKGPRSGALPVHADHPESLFTLLEGSHELVARERVTRLCPPRACAAPERSTSERLGSLVRDTGLVYLHLVAPDGASGRLPSVSTRWNDFLGPGGTTPRGYVYERLADALGSRAAQYREFLDSIEPGTRPRLHFLHVLLPHNPWKYLPSGRSYHAGRGGLEGLDGRFWPRDSRAAEAERRYLLQLGFVDRLVGDLVARLRETGLYDRSLVVLTADHGVSFRPGDSVKDPLTATNAADVAFVPLLVKRPYERRGRVGLGDVRTLDVLPTIADVLGVEVPWPTEGRSLFEPRPRVPSLVVGDRELALDVLKERRAEIVADRARRYGPGWEGVWAAGPSPRLLGARVRALDELPRARARLATGGSFVDHGGGPLPLLVSGRVEGAPAGAGIAVAVALNGVVAAVTEPYAAGGALRFSALLRDDLVRRGRNSVTAHVVAPG